MKKMQNMNHLSVFSGFLGLRDAMKVVRIQFRVLEPKINFLVTKCIPEVYSW